MRDGEFGERGRRPSPGADTGGRGQGPALCRRPGRAAGVLEDEERGAAEQRPRNPVWGTRRGGPFLRLQAQRAVRLKSDSPPEPRSGSAGFPKTFQDAGVVGRD